MEWLLNFKWIRFNELIIVDLRPKKKLNLNLL